MNQHVFLWWRFTLMSPLSGSRHISTFIKSFFQNGSLHNCLSSTSGLLLNLMRLMLLKMKMHLSCPWNAPLVLGLLSVGWNNSNKPRITFSLIKHGNITSVTWRMWWSCFSSCYSACHATATCVHRSSACVDMYVWVGLEIALYTVSVVSWTPAPLLMEQ